MKTKLSNSSRSTALLSALLIIMVGSRSNAFQQQQISAVQQLNDSAAYYADAGQPVKARKCLDRAIAYAGKVAGKERATSYLLLADWQDNEGFQAEALTAYLKSKRLAHEHSNKEIEAAATTGVAVILTSRGEYDSVDYYLGESARLNSSPKNKVRNYLAAGRFWQTQNQSDKALKFYQQAYDEAKTLGNIKSMALALSGMGSVYFTHDPSMMSSKKAIHEALALCDSSKHANLIARNYGRLSNAYMVLGKLDSAELYLKWAKKIVDRSGNLPVRGYILSSYASFMAEKGDIQEALKLSQEPAEIKRKLKQIHQLQNDLTNISEWQMYLHQYENARKTILEGIATSKEMKDVMYLKYFYERLARLDSLTGDYKNAYANSRKSVYYRDSVLSLQRIKAVEEISKKYEAEQKEKTIAEKELVIQRQKYQQSVIIGSSAFSLLILTIFIFILLTRQRSKLQLEKQNRNRLRLQTIVHTQEEVQQSIARDIHDGLVQVMGAAKMSLQSVDAGSQPALMHQRIKEASAIIDDACAEARTISHQLLPYSLMKDGLISSLEELFAKSLAHFQFTKSGDFSAVTNDMAIHIYRIAQEIINNIVKHSEATEVNAYVEIRDKHLSLVIKDNGKGFVPSRHKNQGVGLTNIQTRTELLNGSIDIQSEPGKGTTLILSVPL